MSKFDNVASATIPENHKESSDDPNGNQSDSQTTLEGSLPGSLPVATCNRKRLNLQSTPFSDRHYLQLKIRTWTGAENERLLDAMPVVTRSTSSAACRCLETQSRKQRPASARSDEFVDAVSVANIVGLAAIIAGQTWLIAG